MMVNSQNIRAKDLQQIFMKTIASEIGIDGITGMILFCSFLIVRIIASHSNFRNFYEFVVMLLLPCLKTVCYFAFLNDVLTYVYTHFHN